MYWWFQGMAAVAILLAMGAAIVALAHRFSERPLGGKKGWPHSLEMPIRNAPGFYLTYVACVGLAAAIVLIPRAPLQLIILGVQVLAGTMLPSAIIFLQLLLNDKEVLGDEYINKHWNNWANCGLSHVSSLRAREKRCNMSVLSLLRPVEVNEIPENHFVVVHPPMRCPPREGGHVRARAHADDYQGEALAHGLARLFDPDDVAGALSRHGFGRSTRTARALKGQS